MVLLVMSCVHRATGNELCSLCYRYLAVFFVLLVMSCVNCVTGNELCSWCYASD